MTAPTAVRLLTLEDAVALADDPPTFTRTTGLDVAEGYLAFPAALPRIVDTLRTGPSDRWGAYLIVDPVASTVVGLGGFKGPPVDGTVEVGYSVAPAHRGRGHARATVTAWIALAAEAGVRTVLAHTLPVTDASTAVLERCGFTRVGSVHDDEVGSLSRWQLDVGATEELSSPRDPRR